MSTRESYTAFAGMQSVAQGILPDVARAAKERTEAGEAHQVLVFDDRTGRQVDLDLHGSVEEVIARHTSRAPSAPGFPEAAEAPDTAESPDTPDADATPKGPPAPRRPGRPRLGVVGREVTLLPRHWEWLNVRPGGASVALRKLVEQARRANQERDRIRASREAAYRFMAAVAGNEPGFEEASRALFAGKRERFDEEIRNWPADVRDYALRLAVGGLEAG